MFLEKQQTGNFAKVGEDIKDQDIITIQDAGQQRLTEFKGKERTQFTFSVLLSSKEVKQINMNKTSINTLIDLWGKDTNDWIGKEVRCHIMKDFIDGQMIHKMYLTHPDQELGKDYRDVNKELDDLKDEG